MIIQQIIFYAIVIITIENTLVVTNKRRHKQINNGIHFGIVMSIVHRDVDPAFLLPFHQSFPTISNQTFKNWTLILIGDGLSSDSIRIMYKQLNSGTIKINKSKLIFRNMNESKREVNFLEGKKNHGQPIWKFAGSNSLNEALDIAYSIETITHIARLDDDDRWAANHLELLAHAFQIRKNIGFVHTQASGFTKHPFPKINPNESVFSNSLFNFSFTPPIPCKLIHSSAAWSTNISFETFKFRYRHPEEQFNSTRPLRPICCGPCYKGLIRAVDADMWIRINALIVDRHLFQSIFIHSVTVLYLEKKSKTNLLKYLYANTTSL